MQTPAEAAVLAANRSFYEAFSRRDVSAMNRVWARGHPVACVHPGWDVLQGRERVMASFRSILGSPEAPSLRATDAAALLFGETAIVTCVEHVGGAELVATNVFVFEEGAWRMVHHHASPTARARPSVPPPSSTLN